MGAVASKQVIIFNKKDLLSSKKGKIASIAAAITIRYLLNNNEADSDAKLMINLTPLESAWLFEDDNLPIICSCESQEEINTIIFKSKLYDIDITEASYDVNNNKISCVVVGPTDNEIIDEIINDLKIEM